MTLPIGFGYHWDSAAWYGASSTILLFLIGYVLGFRQGDIQTEQHALQRALGNLELQEKITCFDANSVALRNEPHLLDKAFNLVGDARAAAFLFTHADLEMQARFLDTLDRALAWIPHPVTLPRPDQREQLEAALGELRRNMHDVMPSDGLQRPRSRVDARLAILTSSVDGDELSHLRDAIRVQLNWERFVRERWPVRIEHLTRLDGWFTPWYIGHDGESTDWRASDARPLALAEWRQAGSEHVTKIEDMRRSQGQGPYPALTIVAWALPDGKRLVLDGNHRLAASSHDDGTPGPATAAIVIEGPVSESVLPDLRHWTQGGST